MPKRYKHEPAHYDLKAADVVFQVNAKSGGVRWASEHLDDVILTHADLDQIKVVDPEDILYWRLTTEEDEAEQEARPPSSAVLSALLPAGNSEDVIANLRELFMETWVPRHGLKTARRIWRTQAALLIFWQWATPIVNLVDKARGLKLF